MPNFSVELPTEDHTLDPRQCSRRPVGARGHPQIKQVAKRCEKATKSGKKIWKETFHTVMLTNRDSAHVDTNS